MQEHASAWGDQTPDHHPMDTSASEAALVLVNYPSRGQDGAEQAQ